MMKKALIGLTLALLLLTFVKGSQGLEVELSAVSELNAAVDSTLQTRVKHLAARSRLASATDDLTASLIY
jgi:hypothetical protein